MKSGNTIIAGVPPPRESGITVGKTLIPVAKSWGGIPAPGFSYFTSADTLGPEVLRMSVPQLRGIKLFADKSPIEKG